MLSISPSHSLGANTVKDHQSPSIWKIEEQDAKAYSDHTLFLSSSTRLLQKMTFIIPSFIQRKLRPGSAKPQRLHPTSYLDGLRGVASFIVFMGHYTEENLGWFTEPYGLYEDRAPSSPLQLPFLRVIYSARPMVHIFFVISGYVLAYKALKQIHQQQYAALTNTLSSSVFRRALRLYIPSLFTLFIMAIAVHFGVTDQRYAEPFAGLWTQMRHAGYVCWGILEAAWAMNDMDYPQPVYNPALWTIPVEFSNSLLLFITILGLSRCYTKVRLSLVIFIMWFCFKSGELYAVEFLGGLVIAEVNLIQDRSLLISPSSSPTVLPKFEFSAEDISRSKGCGTTIKEKCIQAFWFANIIGGLFIASWTNAHVDEVWGLRFLSAHTPEPYEGQRVWFCLGAFMIVSALTQLRSMQMLFETGIAQYLGQISYALYLTHNLCLTSLEPRVVPILDTIFSKATFWGRHFSWVAGLCLYLPVILCVADFFWRAVDIPSVKFARWLESKCVVEKKA